MRLIVGRGHDRLLGVAWFRFDAVPSVLWATALARRVETGPLPACSAVLHDRYLLWTARTANDHLGAMQRLVLDTNEEVTTRPEPSVELGRSAV